MSVVKTASEIAPAKGKLGILLVGLGAVSTTTIAGVIAIRKGLAKPIGSLTQMGTIRLGKRTDNRSPKINEFVPLAELDDIVFGGWDIFEDNCYEAAKHGRRARAALLDQISDELEAIKPMPAVFDRQYVKRLDGPNVKKGKNKKDLADQLIADIRKFKATTTAIALVMVWCGSTEVFMTEGAGAPVAGGVREGRSRRATTRFRRAWSTPTRRSRKACRYANAAPNLTADIPALLELARADQLAARRQGPEDRPDADQDDHRARPQGAPARRRRLVLDQHPRQPRRRGAGRSRSRSRPRKRARSRRSTTSSSRTSIPISTRTCRHVVRINYYPPRGDNKEGWDNIDLVGWLGYPMQLKINFLCRDSILAAPIVLDVGAVPGPGEARRACHGIQEWLSFYFKSPMHAPGLYPEHDLFIQLMKLKNTLRYMKGEELITHLGREYYD